MSCLKNCKIPHNISWGCMSPQPLEMPRFMLTALISQARPIYSLTARSTKERNPHSGVSKRTGTYFYREDPKRPEKTRKDPKRLEKTRKDALIYIEKTRKDALIYTEKTRKDPRRPEKTRKDTRKDPKRPEKTFLLLM